MESISAIIFGLILMLPLLVRLQMLVLHPWKLFATLQCYLTKSARDVRCGKCNLVQHYPKLPNLLNSNSESRMMVCSPRTVLSSPAMPHVASAGQYQIVKKTIPLAQHSSSFVATQIELPVVDITCNYNSYRYKTFEESLRKQYGANYPPGEVVLNYIQLNTPDSRTKIGEDIDDDFLDFFEDNDAGIYSSVCTKLETEYLNLLDHFILKQQGKALTAGKFTETFSSNERTLEESSYIVASSQSTLRSLISQQKESKSNNQYSLKGISKYTCDFGRLGESRNSSTN